MIWAGSEKRAAQGMADVTLVLDNADGLLPVDFQVLELGRRLYRSGENDYLLNRERVRLRDLVDLLDSAHLADNAFLFIGQGMVDQALALRPEERRPLFEEVAGVRRHERRRRRAEEQLVESEANLARVEDILGELRPQARRLAAQAEQQATRESTAEELAGALLLAMHARWHDAAGRLEVAGGARERARAAADVVMAELSAAEAAVARLSAARGERARLERERREAHEAARASATAAQIARGAPDVGSRGSRARPSPPARRARGRRGRADGRKALRSQGQSLLATSSSRLPWARRNVSWHTRWPSSARYGPPAGRMARSSPRCDARLPPARPRPRQHDAGWRRSSAAPRTRRGRRR